MIDKLAQASIATRLDLNIDDLLEQARTMCLRGQFEQLQVVLAKLTDQPLSPKQALLQEVLMLYPGATQTP
jgi:hypothetical protein